MRTTLKRGFGRGAAANGNGRAVFPPSSGPLITRYRQPPPQTVSGFGILRRVLLGVLIVLSSLGIGIAGGAYLWFHQSIADVQAHPDLKRVQKELDVALPGHPAIALVIGYDHRRGLEGAGPSRSDTVMLIRADPTRKTLSLLSFPRDLLVPIYCGATVLRTDRINSAYSDPGRCGGPRGTVDTVRHLTGLPINYVVTVDFHGFKKVVNSIGGVWLDIDRRYYNKNTGASYNDYANINLQPGYQLLSGGAALSFVRFRHTDSDLYRLARQQQFVRSMKQQLTKNLSITNVANIVNDVVDNVEVAAGGHKLSGHDVLSWAFFAKGLPPGHVFQPRISQSDLSGYAELNATSGAVQQAVNEFENPDVQSSKAANAAALGKKVKPKAPPPSSVTMTVLNGNGVAGAAANASYIFAQRGYKTVPPPNNLEPNAAQQNFFHSKIYYDPSQAGSKAAAVALQNLMQPADVEKLPRAPWLVSLDPGSMLMVVLGSTFHGDVAQPQVTQVPQHVPPNVRLDPRQSLPLLQQVKSRVSFPLELPTVLERSSYPDSFNGDVAVRAYAIQGKNKAVRLVYRTGSNEYWGIEETNWADAPVLADRSFRHDLGGREFELYYAGSRLHMVVLQANGATYWIVNTLLDSLSNETMLAIAKGLKPLTSVH